VRARHHRSHPRCAPRVVVAIATDERLMSREARVRECKRGVELDGPAVQLHGAVLPLATEVAAARTSWALRCRSQPRRFAVGCRAIRQRAVARRSAGSSSAATFAVRRTSCALRRINGADIIRPQCNRTPVPQSGDTRERRAAASGDLQRSVWIGRGLTAPG
jgi:hypothetical protein